GDLSVAAVREHGGVLAHTISMVEDVTARRRAALEREQYHDALVELARRDVIYSGEAGAAWRVITEAATRTLALARASVWLYTGAAAGIRCADRFQSGSGTHDSGLECLEKDYPAYFAALREDRIIAAHDARRDHRTAELSARYMTPSGVT